MLWFEHRLLLGALSFALGVASGGCGDAGQEHDPIHDHTMHDDSVEDSHEEHVERDPVTQPCDAGNWRELLPDLRECQLAGAKLDGESLRRANLSDADLTGASLVRADLFKAVLIRARLTDAELAGASLTSVDLTDADLSNVSLEGASLTNARLDNAVLAGATTDETTTCPDTTPGPCW